MPSRQTKKRSNESVASRYLSAIDCSNSMGTSFALSSSQDQSGVFSIVSNSDNDSFNVAQGPQHFAGPFIKRSSLDLELSPASNKICPLSGPETPMESMMSPETSLPITETDMSSYTSRRSSDSRFMGTWIVEESSSIDSRSNPVQHSPKSGWRRKLDGTPRRKQMSTRRTSVILSDSSWIRKDLSANIQRPSDPSTNFHFPRPGSLPDSHLADPAAYAPTEIIGNTSINARHVVDSESDGFSFICRQTRDESGLYTSSIVSVNGVHTQKQAKCVSRVSPEVQRRSNASFRKEPADCIGKGEDVSQVGVGGIVDRLDRGKLSRHIFSRSVVPPNTAGSVQSQTITSSVGVETGGRSVEPGVQGLRKVFESSVPSGRRDGFKDRSLHVMLKRTTTIGRCDHHSQKMLPSPAIETIQMTKKGPSSPIESSTIANTIQRSWEIPSQVKPLHSEAKQGSECTAGPTSNASVLLKGTNVSKESHGASSDHNAHDIHKRHLPSIAHGALEEGQDHHREHAWKPTIKARIKLFNKSGPSSGLRKAFETSNTQIRKVNLRKVNRSATPAGQTKRISESATAQNTTDTTPTGFEGNMSRHESAPVLQSTSFLSCNPPVHDDSAPEKFFHRKRESILAASSGSRKEAPHFSHFVANRPTTPPPQARRKRGRDKFSGNGALQSAWAKFEGGATGPSRQSRRSSHPEDVSRHVALTLVANQACEQDSRAVENGPIPPCDHHDAFDEESVSLVEKSVPIEPAPESGTEDNDDSQSCPIGTFIGAEPRVDEGAPNPSNTQVEESSGGEDTVGFDDGVTLDLSIAEVSGLTNPTCLRSREDTRSDISSHLCTITNKNGVAASQEYEGRGPSEASSSQTSEAAAPLLRLSLLSKFVNSSDDYCTPSIGRPGGKPVGWHSPDQAQLPSWEPHQQNVMSSRSGLSLVDRPWFEFNELESSKGWEHFDSSTFTPSNTPRSPHRALPNTPNPKNDFSPKQFNGKKSPERRTGGLLHSPELKEATTTTRPTQIALMKRLKSLKEARTRRMSAGMGRRTTPSLPRSTSQSWKLSWLTKNKATTAWNAKVDDDFSSSTRSSTRFGGSNFNNCLELD